MSKHIEEIVGLVVNDNQLAADRIETMREIGEHISTMIDNKEYKHLCSAIDDIGHAVKRAGGQAGKSYLMACYRIIERCTKEELDILKRKAVEVASVVAIMLSTNDERVQLISEIGQGVIKREVKTGGYGVKKGKKAKRERLHEPDHVDSGNNPDNIVVKICDRGIVDREGIIMAFVSVMSRTGKKLGAELFAEAVKRVK